jgi:endosialidase-like protein
MTRQLLINHLNPSSLLRRGRVLILLTLGSFALCPMTQAVVPAPDGGYPGGNTAEGTSSLLSLTSGIYNTGVGIYSLLSISDGSFCTAVGAGALFANTADQNTATGAGALFSNTTGSFNTANGAFALFSNTDGANNTAVGAAALEVNTSSGNTGIGGFALTSNTTGVFNTAVGGGAMNSTQDGGGNTAMGVLALSANLHGATNTAIGFIALQNNSTSENTAVGSGAAHLVTIGTDNTAIGFNALGSDIIGGANTAIGANALQNAVAGFNTALGNGAGSAVTSATNVIAIGHPGANSPDTCFIGNIRDVTTDLADAITVVIDSAGQLGTASSSQKFKKDIKPMDQASEAILALKPVTFHYKTDKTNRSQFGLIAEEVAEVNPDLIVRDKNGEIYTVRYDQVNAMLLNEFLKEHKKVEEQQANIAELKSTVAQQHKGMEVLTAQLKEQAVQIQKVSAQLELNKAAPQTVADK